MANGGDVDERDGFNEAEEGLRRRTVEEVKDVEEKVKEGDEGGKCK